MLIAPKEMARIKMDEMQGQGMGWTEAQFLQQRLQVLRLWELYTVSLPKFTLQLHLCHLHP